MELSPIMQLDAEVQVMKLAVVNAMKEVSRVDSNPETIFLPEACVATLKKFYANLGEHSDEEPIRFFGFPVEACIEGEPPRLRCSNGTAVLLEGLI